MYSYAAGANVVASWGSSARYARSTNDGKLMSEIWSALACSLFAGYEILFHRDIIKVVLFQCRRCWIKESTNLAMCNKFSAVTRTEYVYHNCRNGLPFLMFRACMAASCRCFITNDAIMNFL